LILNWLAGQPLETITLSVLLRRFALSHDTRASAGQAFKPLKVPAIMGTSIYCTKISGFNPELSSVSDQIFSVAALAKSN